MALKAGKMAEASDSLQDGDRRGFVDEKSDGRTCACIEKSCSLVSGADDFD